MKLPLLIGLRYTGTRSRNQLVAFLSRVSITGLVVGVGLLIAVMSIMNGFDRELRERILGLVPQAAIYEKGGIADWQQLQLRLERRGGIVAAAPFVQLDALVARRDQAKPVMLYGIAPEQERRVSRLAEYLSDETLTQLAEVNDSLVLGQGIAAELGLVEGDNVMIIVPDGQDINAPRIRYFTLLKVLSTHTELDHALALTSLHSAQQLSTAPHTVSGMRLRVDDLFAARDIVWETLLYLGAGYQGSSWVNTHGNLYHAIHMSKRLVSLLMSLIVAIAAFNVVSTLVMVVVEKQGDIAILRTLGATTGQIMQVFVVQGSAIGLLGTGLGVLFGLALSMVIEPLVRIIEGVFRIQFLQSDVYPLTYLPTELLLSDITLVAATALGMSFLATLYPAWRASRTQPAEVLRYE